MPLILIPPLLAAVTAWAEEEHVVYSTAADDCLLSVEFRDAEPALLRLRARAPDFSTCQVSREVMIDVLRRAFSSDGLRLHRPRFASLDVGRLVDYPWLSQYLAEAADHHSGWDSRRGKPKTAPINQFAADILSSPEVLRILNGATRPGGYCVTRASVEKVLVGRDADIPGYAGPRRAGRRPFDSLTWFALHAPEDHDCEKLRLPP